MNTVSLTFLNTIKDDSILFPVLHDYAERKSSLCFAAD